MSRILLLALSLTVLPSTSLSQMPIPRGVREAEKAAAQTEKSIPPPLYRRSQPDLLQMQREADELAELAKTIPGAVAQTSHGILPKDIGERLKKIEKLSKHLRSQIAQ